jgi:malonyl CoA-acyl carrier protein transacylase
VTTSRFEKKKRGKGKLFALILGAVGAAGFSIGGYTAAALLGARVDEEAGFP